MARKTGGDGDDDNEPFSLVLIQALLFSAKVGEWDPVGIGER